MKHTAWVAMAAMVLAISTAAANVTVVQTPESQAMQEGETQDLVFQTTFEVNETSDVYFNILATPGNPVNDGNPNGTVQDGTGQSGWWIGFRLLAGNGDLITDLGDHVSTTGTTKTAINGTQPYIAEATVHVPADGASGSHDVYFSIVQAAAGDGESSGGSKDESKSVKLQLVPPAATPAGDDAGADDNDDSGGGNGNDANTGTETGPEDDIDEGGPDEASEQTDRIPGWAYGAMAAGAAILVGGMVLFAGRKKS